MKKNDTIRNILYIGLTMILFILPFPRGLFFEKEILPVQFIIFLFFILWSIYKVRVKEKMMVNSWMGLAVCILPLAYILPLLFGQAANRYDALSYILRFFAYAAVFFMVSDLTREKKHVLIWLQVLAFSGVCTAILGIDSAIGEQLNTFLGFRGTRDIYGRIQGVLQYPNSFAAYLGMTFFMVLGLGILSEKKILKGIYSGMMVPVVISLLLTVSRGAIAMVPLIFVGLIIALPTKKKRLEGVLLSVFPSVGALAVLGPIQTAVSVVQGAIAAQQEYGSQIGKVWLIVVGAIGVSAILSICMMQLAVQLDRIPDRWYRIGLLAVVGVGIAAVLVLWQTGLYERVLPEFLVQRFSQIGSVAEATSGRTDFYRDGMKLLKSKWLLGAGGGAWAGMYRMVQSYNYGSTEAHNMAIQIWLEAGIIGIGALILLCMGTVLMYLKNRKAVFGTEQAVLLMILWMLLGHSFVDFNFSYFSLPIIGYVLMGAMDGLQEKGKWLRLGQASGRIGFLIGCILILFPGIFMLSRMYAAQATTIIKEEGTNAETIDRAIRKLEQAIQLNRWNINYYIMEKITEPEIQIDLDKLYEMKTNKDATQETIQKQHNILEEALKIYPYNPIINVKVGAFYIRYGEFQQGLEYVEKAVQINPLSELRYEELAQAYLTVGDFYRQQNQNELARQMLERVLQIEGEIESVNQNALKPIGMTAETKEYIQMADMLLDQIA